MSHRIWTGLVALSAIIVVGALAQAAAPEDKLPASASLVVLLVKPSEAAAKWQKTALGGMLSGQDFVPFYGELQKGEIAAPLHPRPALGFDWADIAKFQQPAALAILEGDAKQPALVFLAVGKEDEGEVKRVMVNAEKYFDARKASRVVKKSAGGEMVTYDVAAAGGKAAIVCVHITKGELFAATNSSAAADQLLKLWEAGDKESLLRDPDFMKFDAQAPKLAGETTKADVRWFIRPLALAELLQKKPDPKVRGGKDLVAVARKQGASAISAIGGVLLLQPNDKHDYELGSVILAKRPFEKGLRLADFKAGKAIEPPDWVEADVGSYLSWNWDLPAVLEGAGAWADEKLGDEGAFAAFLSDLRITKQVDVRLDVLSRMGPGIFAVGDSHRTKDPSNPTGFRLLIGVQSKEQAKLAKKMPGLTRDDATIKEEVVADNPVRYAPDGEPLFTEPSEEGLKNTRSIQAYGVTPTLSLFSTDLAWLRSKLTAKEKVKPLVDDPAYKQLALWTAKQENKQTCLRGFLRSDQSGRLDYDAVRGATVTAKSSLRAKALQFALLGNSPAAAKASAAALPKFDALAPNLMPSGISMAVSPYGFEFRAAVLRKE
jgi:hypothetical protein